MEGTSPYHRSFRHDTHRSPHLECLEPRCVDAQGDKAAAPRRRGGTPKRAAASTFRRFGPYDVRCSSNGVHSRTFCNEEPFERRCYVEEEVLFQFAEVTVEDLIDLYQRYREVFGLLFVH